MVVPEALAGALQQSSPARETGSRIDTFGSVPLSS